MATVAGTEVPSLEALVGAVLDRLPAEALRALAGSEPVAAAERGTFVGQVVELAQSLAADRVCGVEHVPNEETARAIRDARAGRDVTVYASVDEAFKDLGI